MESFSGSFHVMSGRYCSAETNRSGKRTRELLVVSSVTVLALANSADFDDAAVTELPEVGARKGGEAGDEEAGCSETRDWVVSIASILRRFTETAFSSPVRRILIVLSLCKSTWDGRL